MTAPILWSADGWPGTWSADGYPGWSADGYIPYGAAAMRVKAVAAGFYNGDYKDIGDVFDIYETTDFSSSTVSQVPVSNPDYPVYGWMTQVPSTTPLFSWALANGGASSPRTSPRRTIL